MTNELKNIFFTTELSNIFQKHHWHMLSNSDEKYHFNYRGEIADYYLMLSYNNNTIKFNYTLDIEVPKDKINDLLMLINFVNQKNQDGFFVFDFEVNKVKFYFNKQCFLKLKKKILEDVIEENLNRTNSLFLNFTLAIHNLVYSEKIDQSSFQLMFLKIEGCA
jgi:hypothetical protein